VKYAIDYDGIVSGIMRGHGRRIGSIMMPGMLGFPESLNTALLYRHDPAKAAGLMKEAGVQKAGVPLTWAAGTSYGALPLDRLARPTNTAGPRADTTGFTFHPLYFLAVDSLRRR